MNILLLEPDYKSKYPPLGLMKIAYYHKEIRGDFVWLCKGKVPEEISDAVKEKLRSDKYHRTNYGDQLDEYISEAQQVIDNTAWDRIYVTTLFTYEWDKTVRAIEYAKTLVGADKVYVGGILATLMPEELERETGIKPMTGLLTDSAVLGFDDGVNIDRLTPDYSILVHTEYNYPRSDSYIVRATRGCGMKCSFCAVQTLEPQCVDYIPITDTIREIDEKYGERRHLCLTDNNILKSRSFERIIQDVIDLGYLKGAARINPKTGKPNNVYVDINSGLDTNFVTEAKMALLSKLPLRPVRIAFDHISEEDKYVRAMRLAEKHDIRHMSNYMLYNTEAFRGKGVSRAADTPEDLYRRLRINKDLREEFNSRRRAEGKRIVEIYSYPMKFAPLDCTNRDFIGPGWNRKTISALSKITAPFNGVAHCNRFEYSFGKTSAEFRRILWQPSSYIENRGTRDNMTWTILRREWTLLYTDLNNTERNAFEAAIQDNEYNVELYLELPSLQMRQLYLHYLYSTKLLAFMTELRDRDALRFEEARQYLVYDCPVLHVANRSALASLKSAGRYLYEIVHLLTPELCTRVA